MKIFLATVVIAASLLSGSAQAAGNASFSLSPSTGSYQQNSNFTVQIYENGSDVNVVTVKLSYDASKLQCVSVGGNSAFGNDVMQPSCGNGVATISRFTGFDANGNPTVLNGSQLVGSVGFKALAASGSSSVSFAAGSQIASNGANIWNGNPTGGTYSFTPIPVAPTNPTNPTNPSYPSNTVNPGNTPSAKPANSQATTSMNNSNSSGSVTANNGQSTTTESSNTAAASTETPAANNSTDTVNNAATKNETNKAWVLLVPALALIAVAAVVVKKFAAKTPKKA